MSNSLAPNKPLETTKHRELVAKYCYGDGLDLGSFTDPINDRAIRIDRDPRYAHIVGNVSDLSRFADSQFDYVHSSHVLEDFAVEDWPEVLAEWSRVLKPGGNLIISVPDHERFRAAVAGGQGDNLDHKHESHLGEVQTFLPDWKVELSQFVAEGDYSIIVVLKKPGDILLGINRGPKGIKTFGHSGDLGDLIYHLPTMQAICERDNAKAEIILYRGPGVREPFTPERAMSMGDLLLELPWVRKFKFWPGRIHPSDVNYDFQEWRDYYGKHCDNGRGNLARTAAEYYRVDPKIVDRPWITNIKPAFITAAPPDGGPTTRRAVVIARSPRYRNRAFPWQELTDRYRHRSVMVGTEAEQVELGNQFDLYCNAITPSLFDLAQVIASAELVITNQTAAYAIAEAMKKPVVLERCTWVPNVDFDRPDVWSGDRVKEFMDMPDPIGNCEPEAARPQVQGVRRSA